MAQPGVFEHLRDPEHLAGPGDSTLYRWKARSGGWNSTIIATDTIRNVGASPIKRFINTISYGVKLHDLGESYLSDPAAVARLLLTVEHIRRECEPGELIPSWSTSPPFYRGDEIVPWLYFELKNFNGRKLYGRTLGIASADSSVVTILPNRVARAVAHGSTSIIGSYGVMSELLPFTVGPVPIVLSGGSREGRWIYPNPYEEGFLSLSGMAQVDSVTPLGAWIVSGGMVSYTYNGTNYSTPALGATIVPGGSGYSLRFNMDTPEYPPPYSYASVQITIHSNGTLTGGMHLYSISGFRESRIWELGAPLP